MTSSHYEALGVPSDADQERIRHAYRDLARRLHPDHVVQASAAERALADRRMREVNEAWRVLRDPASRRAYDAGRAGPRSGAGSARRTGSAARVDRPRPSEVADVDEDDDLVPVAHGPGAGLVWIALLVVLAAIFLFTAYAARGSDPPTTVPPAQRNVGHCVLVHPGPTTTPVDCRESGALRIVSRVDQGERCPAGAEARRLATDGRFECVVAAH